MSPAALAGSNQEARKKCDDEHAETLRCIQEYEKQLVFSQDILPRAVSELNAAVEHQARAAERWATELQEERNQRKRSNERVVKLKEEINSLAQRFQDVQIEMRREFEMGDSAIAEASDCEEKARQELFDAIRLVEEVRGENRQIKDRLARLAEGAKQRQVQIREVERYTAQLSELQRRQQQQLVEMMNIAAADVRFISTESGKGLAIEKDIDVAMPDDAGPSRRRAEAEIEEEELCVDERMEWHPGPARGIQIGGARPSLGRLGGGTGSLSLLASESLGTLAGEGGSLNTGNLLASDTLGTLAEVAVDDNQPAGVGVHQAVPQAAEDSDAESSDGGSPLMPPQENAAGDDEEHHCITSGPGVESAARDEDRPKDAYSEVIRSQVGNSDTQPAVGDPPVDPYFAESQGRPTVVAFHRGELLVLVHPLLIQGRGVGEPWTHSLKRRERTFSGLGTTFDRRKSQVTGLVACICNNIPGIVGTRQV